MTPQQVNALAELEMVKADATHAFNERKNIMVAEIVNENGKWKIVLPYYADQQT